MFFYHNLIQHGSLNYMTPNEFSRTFSDDNNFFNSKTIFVKKLDLFIYSPITGGEAGQIYINGNEVIIKSPSDAINFGIGMVHQEFMLIPSFKVYENVILGMERTKKFIRSIPQTLLH